MPISWRVSIFCDARPCVNHVDYGTGAKADMARAAVAARAAGWRESRALVTGAVSWRCPSCARSSERSRSEQERVDALLGGHEWGR